MAIDSAHANAAAARGDDAVFKVATSDQRGLSMLDDDEAVASQPTLPRLFAQLSSEANLPLLRAALFDSAAKAVHATGGGMLGEVTLDIDSYPIPVHGHQAGSERNGYYRARCYHPLGVMLGETGHWLDLKLRPGNVSTADGANEMLAPLIDRARTELSENVRVRGDAGFIGAETLAMLDAKDVPYALRLPTNANLKAYEEIHAVRPPGRPPGYERIWSHEIEHRALTSEKPRRVVLVVVETPGELFLRSFFIVTSFSKDEKCGRDVLDFYRERGTMEAHIGEMKAVIDGRVPSTNRTKTRYARREVVKRAKPVDPERVNAAALCLHGLALNLLNTFRALAGSSAYIDEPPEMGMRRARRLLLVAGRVVVSAPEPPWSSWTQPLRHGAALRHGSKAFDHLRRLHDSAALTTDNSADCLASDSGGGFVCRAPRVAIGVASSRLLSLQVRLVNMAGSISQGLGSASTCSRTSSMSMNTGYIRGARQGSCHAVRSTRNPVGPERDTLGVPGRAPPGIWREELPPHPL